MDERAFLGAIREEPDADVHRLVFADWLDERGQADRAEFIRAQVTLAAMGELDPRRAALEERERRLLAAHAPDWADPWPRWERDESRGGGPWGGRFRRGLVESLDLGPGSPARGGDRLAALFAAHPIRELNFRGEDAGTLEALAGRDELRRVEGLSAHDLPVLAGIDAVLASPRLTRLRRLTALAWDVTGDHVARWLRTPAVVGLEGLHVPAAGFPVGRFLQAIVRADFPSLREFTLPSSSYALPAEPTEEFVRSAAWPRLRSLDVPRPSGVPWPAALARGRLRRLKVQTFLEGPSALAEALASFAGEPTLERLEVTGELATGEALSRVLDSPALGGLRRLDLRHARLTADDVGRLGRSPLLARLERLAVGFHPEAGGAAAAALLASPGLGRLTHLTLGGNGLSRSAAAALARNGSRGRLRHLELEISGDAATGALLSGEPYPDLHTLRLSWPYTPPRPRTLAVLLDSPKLPRLCVVRFDVQARDREALTPVFRRCARLAWAGGEFIDGYDGVRVAVKPTGVYLPNHLSEE